MKPLLLSSTAAIIPFLIWALPAKAGIISDSTLLVPSIVPPNCTTCEITGGTTRGSNLFHSFEQFTVVTGGEAFFNNDISIANIFSRVTGDAANIDGLVRSNGSANLFLLSPKGISFGPNATLSIGGSFIASTAESVTFSDGFSFTPTTNAFPSLLTISVPTGLQLGVDAGSITNRSQASPGGDINAFGGVFGLGDLAPVGLKTAPQETLALIGNGIILDNGNLTAPGGQIELASLAPNSTVQLNQADESLRFKYGDSPSFADLTLTNFSLIDVSDLSGSISPGNINLSGKNIEFSQLAQAFALTLSPTAGQPFNIQASETLRLDGADPDFGLNASLFTLALGDGPANSINVTAKNVEVLDGASLGSATFSTTGGNTGKLSIDVGETLLLSGETVGEMGSAPSSIATQVFDSSATGNADSIRLTAQQLTIEGGAQLIATTFGFGDSGNINIKLTDEIILSGTAADGITPSGILTESNSSSGRAGDITIIAPRIRVTGGAIISSATAGLNSGGSSQLIASDSILLSGTAPVVDKFTGRTGRTGRSSLNASAAPVNLTFSDPNLRAGSFRIKTPQLTVEEGALISTDTFRQFSGGDVELNVEQLSLLSGGQIRTASLFPPDGSTPLLGKGGTLTANISDRLEISGSTTIDNQTIPSALIAVAEGAGAAGNLRVVGPDNRNLNISVGSGGEINASTATSIGGDIDIRNASTFLLTDSGSIAAEAGSAELNGDGGNININSTFIIALGDADIVANAFEGSGGNITLTAQSILGLEQRRATPNNGTNDLDASSELGINGNVILNQPDVDPSRGLAELPENLADPSDRIAQGCRTDSATSSFVASGRGGIPQGPAAPLQWQIAQEEWIEVNRAASAKKPGKSGTTAALKRSQAVIAFAEAQTWQRNRTGQIQLIAEVEGGEATLASANCHAKPIK